MATKGSEPGPARPGTLQSMLARLRGMAEAIMSKPEEQSEEVLPPWDDAGSAGPPSEIGPAAPTLAASELEPPPAAAIPVTEAAASTADQPPPAAQVCPHCSAPRNGGQSYCENCGWVFPSTPVPPPTIPAAALNLPSRIRGRYELGELIGERLGVCRYRGRDYASGPPEATAVVIVRSAAPPAVEAVPASEDTHVPQAEDVNEAEILPSFEDPIPAASSIAVATCAEASWPGVAWECDVLEKVAHPAWPRILDRFVEDGWEYLIEESPQGRPLWDAWDDVASTAQQRFGWLKQLAEAIDQLHRAGAMLEGLRPEIIAVTADGLTRLTDVSDLLPLPLPDNAPIRATLYTAPELVVSPEQSDGRADLYSFGAMLYALHVGRELAEVDFDRQGVPKPFIPRFPDIHPAFGRLMAKTFCREVNARFPSDEAAQEDPTGFRELIRTLEVCQRTLDQVRLEIAAWTTTGMVRTGNEDAFALLHGIESRQDDLSECALVLLADGMGGYEAGEVAAAMAIQTLRQYLLQQPSFAFLAGASSLPGDGASALAAASAAMDVETCKQHLSAALKEANKQVFAAARSGAGRRGMGSTAEVVFVGSRYVVVGHVGDSRTYHLHEGRLIQLTRDQTLVNRLVELGTLTPEEAENHPRRSELQQAIGGHPDVIPDLYHSDMKPGDWIIVGSDGLSNHITADELKQMLQSEATSAEMAARRLVNFANVKGATDNATVVVIRAT